MPQSLAQVWIHIIFSAKDRQTYLQNPELRREMFRMMAHHVGECGCVSASIGGHDDRVHLLVGISRTITIAQLVEKVKVETSKWAKKVEQGTPRFAWQSGYGAFSVSHSVRDELDQYIRNQATHHATMSFQGEFRRICEKHEIKIDERYVWD